LILEPTEWGNSLPSARGEINWWKILPKPENNSKTVKLMSFYEKSAPKTSKKL
jgi:hypothetical protein